jgi:hypothetical protein
MTQKPVALAKRADFNELDRHIRSFMESRGFSRTRLGVYRLPLGRLQLYIDLNFMRPLGRISPIIGVEHKPAEALMVELSNLTRRPEKSGPPPPWTFPPLLRDLLSKPERPTSRPPWTFTIPLRDTAADDGRRILLLQPAYWLINPNNLAGVQRQVEQFVDIDFLPFSQRVIAPDFVADFVESMERSGVFSTMFLLYIPMIYWCEGQRQKAEEYLDKGLSLIEAGSIRADAVEADSAVLALSWLSAGKKVDGER